MINNDQGRFSLGGMDDLTREADGSVILYFGPVAPEGYEQNWIQTNPGEGWFTLPRLFAPLEPILDKPGDGTTSRESNNTCPSRLLLAVRTRTPLFDILV